MANLPHPYLDDCFINRRNYVGDFKFLHSLILPYYDNGSVIKTACCIKKTWCKGIYKNCIYKTFLVICILTGSDYLNNVANVLGNVTVNMRVSETWRDLHWKKYAIISKTLCIFSLRCICVISANLLRYTHLTNNDLVVFTLFLHQDVRMSRMTVGQLYHLVRAAAQGRSVWRVLTGGISADPKKVAAIQQARDLQDPSEIWSLLGMANHCSRFIRDSVSISAPLH